MERLRYLIDLIWYTETMPTDWSTAVICPIFKKGDATLVANYRGIALLEIGHKLFSTILLFRIKPLAENLIGEYQSGFRKGKSTTDHISTLRLLMERCYEYDHDLHILFIDF